MPTEKSPLTELLNLPLSSQESRGYAHTASEIASQPAVWRMTRNKVSDVFSALSSFCGEASRVLVTGAGSSYYAAASIVPLLRHSFGAVEAIPSTEILMGSGLVIPTRRVRSHFPCALRQ